MKTSISDQNEREVPARQVQTIQRSTPEVETMVLRDSDAGPAHVFLSMRRVSSMSFHAATRTVAGVSQGCGLWSSMEGARTRGSHC